MESEEKDDKVTGGVESSSVLVASECNDVVEDSKGPDCEGNVQVILEQVSDEGKEDAKEETSVEEKVDKDSVKVGDSNSQKESSDLGKILEQRLDDVVRRNSTEENTQVSKTESKDEESLKRKHEDSDKQSSSGEHRKERSGDDRHRDHRSKDHKKSSKDRDREHRRDKERSHHHDRHHHRDRDKRREKKVASVGSQCDLVMDTGVKEEPRLMFPDADTPLPPVAGGAGIKRCGYSMANPLRSLAGLRDYTFAHMMYLEVYANGGGKVLHAWQEDVDTLSEKEAWVFAEEFLKEAFIEVNSLAVYCAAIVHNAAKGLPDFLEYLGDEHPNLPVKHGVIGHPRELETTTMSVYRDKVRDHFCSGTFRYGHLDNLSLVGTASEEAGGFFPDILDMLDEIPILSLVCHKRYQPREFSFKIFFLQTMPWGPHSVLHDKLDRNKSNDGPILWIRPGEQSIPTAELGKSPLKR